MIDKRKIFKTLIVMSIVVAITIMLTFLLKDTNARYESASMTSKEADVAFWITDNSIKNERIIVKDIYPSETPYSYNFSVSNFEGNKKAEVALEYYIYISATANLPLEYSVYKDGIELVKREEIITDKFGTNYKKIIISPEENDLAILPEKKQTQMYELKILFPKKYLKNFEYSDSIVDLKVELQAQQKIE